MKRWVLCFCVVVMAIPCLGADQIAAKALYDSHAWFHLRDAISPNALPGFYPGIVACAFNRLTDCDRNLSVVMESWPKSDRARDAHEALAYAYQRAGDYPKAAAEIDALSKLTPDAPDVRNALSFYSSLRNYPKLTVTSRQPSKIRYRIDDGNMFIPVTINGRQAEYMVDTGANFSLISESEAKRLGLTIHQVTAKGSNATGGEVTFRTAMAEQFELGDTHLRNVAFLVVDDSQQPFVDVPQQQRGIIGLPVFLVLQTIRWRPDGVFEVAPEIDTATARDPNLFMEGGEIFVQAEFASRKITLLLDTGATTTRLWPKFASDFPKSVAPYRKNQSTEIRGVGGKVRLESVEVPELRLRIGGAEVTLHPGQVLLKETIAANRWRHGSLGLDLLSGSQTVTMDFRSMVLTLQ